MSLNITRTSTTIKDINILVAAQSFPGSLCYCVCVSGKNTIRENYYLNKCLRAQYSMLSGTLCHTHLQNLLFLYNCNFIPIEKQPHMAPSHIAW